jgi:hypothetical protein
MESKKELKEQFPDTKYAVGLVIPVLKHQLRVLDNLWYTDMSDEKRRGYAIEKRLILYYAGLFGLSKYVNSDAPLQTEHPLSASVDGEGT